MDELGRFTLGYRDSDGRVAGTGVELRRFAARQHGVLRTSDLRRHGFDRNRIARWVRSGHLFRPATGVYTITPQLSQRGRWLAAVFACGPGALLSHLSAAALWGLAESDPVVIDVTAPRSRGPRDGIRVHRPSLQPAAGERVQRQGVPVTSAARTFLDLASMLSEERLTRALRAGERMNRFTPASLLAAPGPSRGRAGIATARRVLERHAPAPGRFRSGLESDFWPLLAADPEIDEPEVNVRVAGYEVDLLWRSQRLIAELDGDPWHRTSVDRLADRDRDATHTARGYLVLRFSDEDVDERPREAIAAIKQALRQRSEGRAAPRPEHP